MYAAFTVIGDVQPGGDGGLCVSCVELNQGGVVWSWKGLVPVSYPIKIIKCGTYCGLKLKQEPYYLLERCSLHRPLLVRFRIRREVARRKGGLVVSVIIMTAIVLTTTVRKATDRVGELLDR